MSRGRKERTPAQLAVLAQAREKAKIVIAERAKLNALAKKDEEARDQRGSEEKSTRRRRVPGRVQESEGVSNHSRSLWCLFRL